MKIKFEFKPYKRFFQKPLESASGALSTREGILIKLENAHGHYGFGEIITPFSNAEKFAEALAVCQIIGPSMEEDQLTAILEKPSCYQYAFQSAYLSLKKEHGINATACSDSLNTVGLCACNANEIYSLITRGFWFIKIKIGVHSFSKETQLLQSVFEENTSGIRFRLDANASLDFQATKKWLTFLDAYTSIDFLEQPLPVSQEKEMKKIAKDFRTPIALDESVRMFPNLIQLDELNWQGPVVIKPSLLGDLQAFLKWRQATPFKLIYSPAFETDFGLSHIISLALSDPENPNNEYGVSLGTIDYFPQDGYHCHSLKSQMDFPFHTSETLNTLWQSLPKVQNLSMV